MHGGHAMSAVLARARREPPAAPPTNRSIGVQALQALQTLALLAERARDDVPRGFELNGHMDGPALHSDGGRVRERLDNNR